VPFTPSFTKTTRRFSALLAAGSAAVALVAMIVSPAGATAPTPATPPPAGPASSSFGFGVKPYNAPGAPVRAGFSFSLSPGQSIRDAVVLSNPGPQPKSFYLYGADAYTEPIGGGYALTRRADRVTDAGGWISLPVAQYTVPATTAAIVPVTINVPADATPGDHSAGIVAEAVIPSTSVQQGHGLVVVQRVASRVYIRVAGALHPGLSITNFSVKASRPALGTDHALVVFTLANNGNVRVQLDKVSVKVTGLVFTLARSAISRPAANQPAQATGFPDQILPGGKIVFSRAFNHLLPVGPLSVSARADGEEAQGGAAVHGSSSVGFIALPWLPIGLVILAVVLAVVWRGVRRRRRDRFAVVMTAEELDVDAPGDVPVRT